MKFSTVRNSQAYTEIVEQICDAILKGNLRRGDRLPSERRIAKDTGISRTSVREALKILTDAGMLEVTPGWGGGTRLVSISMPAELIGDPIGNDPQLMLQFYEARNIIEAAAAQLTALRATPALIRELELTIIEMERLVEEDPDDYQTYFEIDSHFHRLVIKGSSNSILFDLYVPIMRKLWMVKDSLNVEEFHSYGLPSMKDFVQAVKARNPEAAAQAINDHVKPLLNLMHHAYENKQAVKSDGAVLQSGGGDGITTTFSSAS